MYKMLVVETFIVTQEDIEFDCSLKNKTEHWLKSEKGQWVSNHSMEKPLIHYRHDYLTLEMVVTIVAKLKLSDVTLYYLLFN